MPVSAKLQLSQFALDVAEGLSASPKKLSPRYFYDDLGAALFEAITLLPEYGLTRADERLISSRASQIGREVGAVDSVLELGSGSGKKTKRILEVLAQRYSPIVYRPIDVSSAALAACEQSMSGIAEVKPVCGDWIEGLASAVRFRRGDLPFLVLFLGSSIGNLDREAITGFLRQLRSSLHAGDLFLLGADLVKDVETMLAAYDDPTGVTAAFNLNILGRMNRELGANFDLSSFAHEARWNSNERRVEMHLRSGRDQSVSIGAIEATFLFRAGETIWTESSHKFSEPELNSFAWSGGFLPVHTWVDPQWPFAEALWRAA
ncbi:MAG: L-histidine N(alpha)-methyltransferase [Acidobacteriaceae bacterium]|nr:L-histidine N(alpha)-methyltransferase [Acidobacteriaceae bacterium]